MITVAERLLAAVQKNPGQTDRYFSQLLFGPGRHPSQVNQEARLLADRGLLLRKRRDDGRWGNFPVSKRAERSSIRQKVLRLVKSMRRR